MKAATEPPAAVVQPAHGGAFSFAGFTLDTEKGVLRRGQAPVELRPKSFALLGYLVRHAGRVIPKEELLDAVWNDVTVTEDSVTQCIRDIRLALGAEGQVLIRTLPRRGYLFEKQPDAAGSSGTTAAPDRHSRPRLAVLPFRNLGGRADQDYLCAGITEDIITALARFSSLTVTGRHAVNGLAGLAADPQTAAEAFGVSYIVDGSLRFAGNRIRITARLLAVHSGITLWADNFDRGRDSIFAIQDEVVTSIAAALDERLVVDGAGQARQKPAGNWSAYDCLLQGRELCNQHREFESLPFLREAVERDPESALALGWYAIAQSCTYAMTANPIYRDASLQSATQALQCDDRNDTAHWGRAAALLWSGQLSDAGPHFRRAMSLNPANIQVRGDYAGWLRYGGHTEAAEREIDAALQQDPFAPQWFHAVRAGVLFDKKDYAGARAEIRTLPFQNACNHMYYISACTWQGDTAAVGPRLNALFQLMPHASIAAAAGINPYADPAQRQHFLDGLRKAGLPEA